MDTLLAIILPNGVVSQTEQASSPSWENSLHSPRYFATLRPWSLCEVLTLLIWLAAVALPWEQILESLRTSGLYHLHDANSHRHTSSPDPPSESRTEYSWHPLCPRHNMCKHEVLDPPASPPVHPIPLLLLLPETEPLYPCCSHSISHQALSFLSSKVYVLFPHLCYHPLFLQAWCGISSCLPEFTDIVL